MYKYVRLYLRLSRNTTPRCRCVVGRRSGKGKVAWAGEGVPRVPICVLLSCLIVTRALPASPRCTFSADGNFS